MKKIPWNGKVHSQTYHWLSERQNKMYSSALKPENRWRRTSGLALGPATFFFQSARVASSFEPLIKGIVNIGGALFSRHCHFTYGIKQLVYYTPKRALFLLVAIPFLAVLFVVDLIAIPLLVALAPNKAVRLMGIQDPIPGYQPK